MVGGGRWFLPGMPLLAARPPVLQASRGGERGVNLRDTRDEGLSPGVWVARQCGMVQPPEGPPLFCGSRGLTFQTTDVRYRQGAGDRGLHGGVGTSVDCLLVYSNTGGSSGPAPKPFLRNP